MKKLLEETIQDVYKTKKSKSLIFFNGKFHETGIFDHFRKYINVAEGKFLEFLQELQEKKEAAYEHCEQLIDEGVHPEWHNYDMISYDVNSKATDAFYNENGVRVLIDYNMNAFFEGKARGLESVKSYILYCTKHKLINNTNVNNVENSKSKVNF